MQNARRAAGRLRCPHCLASTASGRYRSPARQRQVRGVRAGRLWGRLFLASANAGSFECGRVVVNSTPGPFVSGCEVVIQIKGPISITQEHGMAARTAAGPCPHLAIAVCRSYTNFTPPERQRKDWWCSAFQMPDAQGRRQLSPCHLALASPNPPFVDDSFYFHLPALRCLIRIKHSVLFFCCTAITIKIGAWDPRPPIYGSGRCSQCFMTHRHYQIGYSQCFITHRHYQMCGGGPK